MHFSLLQIMDVLGTFSFAVSGAAAAIRKKLDAFGIFVIAFVTAAGGGTLRDVLIGNTPVGWLRHPTAIYVVLMATAGTLLYRTQTRVFNYTLFLFDAIGLGLFTIAGIQKGLELAFSPGICIALGTVTGSFGGVVRDLLLNEIPIIFRKEIYASACIAGGCFFFLLSRLGFPGWMAQSAGIAAIVIIRIIAVQYNLSLPVFYKDHPSGTNHKR